MKTISVSVDDETHWLVRVEAAETGTAVSAMMRDMLLEVFRKPAATAPEETELEKRSRLLG